MEILGVRDNSRKGYTDIADYKKEPIMDLAISGIMETERAIVLQFNDRLSFSIVPIPVS